MISIDGLKKYRNEIKDLIFKWYIREKDIVQQKVKDEWKLLVRIAKFTGNLSTLKEMPTQEVIKYTKERNEQLRQK